MKSSYIIIGIMLICTQVYSAKADNYRWSVSNPHRSGEKNIFISEIDGTYTDPNTGQEIERWESQRFNPPLTLRPGFKVSSNVHDSPNLRSPNDYHVISTDPGFTSDFWLAFLAGSPGNFRMLDLGDASRSRGFVGDNEFTVPALFSDNLDLFVAIDLSRWLDSPTNIAPGQAITLTGGMSDLLPGFLVSTAPISFNMESGFTTDSPLSGTVNANGILDGSAIPEPSSLVLTGIGGIMMLGYFLGMKGRGHFRSRTLL